MQRRILDSDGIGVGGDVDKARRLTLIHLSDLHIHDPITESGRRLRWFQFGIRTHRYFLLQAASEALEKIRRDESGSTIVLAVTGDLTTAGTPVAFGLARQLLSGSEVVAAERRHPIGLNEGHRFFVVPGNHDRLSSTWIALQESAFETEFVSHLPIANWTKYGLVRPLAYAAYPRLPYVFVVHCAPVKGPGLSIVAIGLDSTELQGIERHNLYGRIAQGRVSSHALQYLKGVCDDVHSNHRVTDSSGETHALDERAVRIVVLLHHHPHLPPDERGKNATRLLNAREVLTICGSSRVDALLFGHEHLPFVDSVTIGSRRSTPVRLICAATGSLSVYDEKIGNFFTVYRITEDSFSFDVWRFQDGLFRPSGLKGSY